MGIFVDIDALLDTRAIILERVNKGNLKKALVKKVYFERLSDDFSKIIRGFRDRDFTKYWKTRDVSVLREAKMTPIAIELHKLKADLNYLSSSEVMEWDGKLTVNCYPYVLTKTEKSLMAEVIAEAAGFENVDVISLLPDFITPVYIRGRFSHVVLYDFNEWLEFHGRSVASTPIAAVQFITPLLIKGKNPLSGSIDDMVEEARAHLRGVLDYRPQPMEMFCFLSEEEKEETPPSEGEQGYYKS